MAQGDNSPAARILNLELEGGIPEGFIPLEVVSVVKCLDQEGEPALCVRQSGGLSSWEIIGMLTAGADAARDELKHEFRDYEDKDE